MNIDGTNNNSVSNAFRMKAPPPTETRFVEEVERKVSNLQPKPIRRASSRQLKAKTVRSLGTPSTVAKKEVAHHQTPRHPTISDASSANTKFSPRPTETKFIDESEPKSTAKTSARQFGPQVFEAKETSSRVAPAALPEGLSIDQIQNIHVVSDAALVKSSMVEKRVSKNNHDWKKGEHVDDATIAKFTPKENIADGEDTVFLDEDGNFICSIAYEAIDVQDDALDILAKVPRSNRERGAAGGPIDRKAMDKFYEDKNKKNKSSSAARSRDNSDQWVEYSEKKPWVAYLKGKRGKKRGNAHYSTSFGCARSYKIPAQVEASQGDKIKKFEIVKPYFKLISDCFEKKWSDQYRSYTQAMKEIGGDNFYLADSVFSSIVVNTHKISSSGKVEKDAGAAIHTDRGHHDESFEVMLCLSKNIDGGDLYLPEYGILLKLRHRCVVCFRAKVYKHAVTEIRRKELDSTALRVTLVAYMTNFAEDTLKIAIESKRNSLQPVSQSTSPRFKPNDFEEGGEEENEPAAPTRILKRGAAKKSGSGISKPLVHRNQPFGDRVAAQAAPSASLAPPPQGLFYSPLLFQSPFYPLLSGAPVNPISGYVPHQSAYFSGTNMSFIPTDGGIPHAQHVQALQEQLLESQRERERLESEILAMRASTAYSQASQQPPFKSNESRDEVAVSSVWHTETCTSPAGTEARGLKRPPGELEIDELLKCMPLEKQARHQKQ